MTDTKAYKIIKGKYVVKNYDLKFISQIPSNIDSIISFVKGL